MRHAFMRHAVKIFGIIFLMVSLALAGGFAFSTERPPTTAQDAPVTLSASECGTPLNTFWFTASEACVGKPYGFVCNGGIRPQVEPQGAVSNSLASVGSLVQTSVIDSIRTASVMPTGTNGGIAWMRVAVPDTLVQYEALMIGDVFMQDRTPPEAAAANPELAWQSFVVVTTAPQSTCETAPRSSLVVQSIANNPARMLINGASLDLRGTLIVQTDEALTTFTLIEGTLNLIVNGRQRSLITGQAVSARYDNGDFATPIGEPFEPFPFDPARVEHLPVLLFDRPVRVTQGALATTTSTVNLRAEPSLEAQILQQIEGGVNLTVLGRNPSDKWFHVRLPNGLSGWMWWEFLDGTLDGVQQVYTSTPAPLTRSSTLNGRLEARVIAPRGTTLRSAPDASYPAVGQVDFGRNLALLARSPYNAWVKVQLEQMVGWVPLITVETAANFEVLEIDTDVPAQLEPTAVPGIFGNAFPDPNCYPNCGP